MVPLFTEHNRIANVALAEDRIIGTHYIIDLLDCDLLQIDSPAILKTILKTALEQTDITLLEDAFHKFEPHGVTGFVLLSSSHISIHSWPEYEYISIDVYSCSPPEMIRRVVDYIVETIAHKQMTIRRIDRAYHLPPRRKDANMTLTLPIYKEGEQVLHLTARIETVNSAFQHIEIVDTKEFERCLLIDGILQASQKDHHIYDEALLEALSSNDRHIIILGGGDGFVAQTALRINPALRITVVDLDAEVVAAAKRHFGQTIFDHPNVQLHCADALTFLRTRRGDFADGIVSDLTDNPMISSTPDNEKDCTRFYAQLLPLAKAHLRSGAWISLQAGASFANKSYPRTSNILHTLVAKHFGEASRKDIFVPSFGEENCFLVARKALE